MKRRFPPMGLDDTFRFGQYGPKSGSPKQLWEVLDTDPEHVRYLIEDADMDFEIDDEAYEVLQRRLGGDMR